MRITIIYCKHINGKLNYTLNLTINGTLNMECFC